MCKGGRCVVTPACPAMQPPGCGVDRIDRLVVVQALGFQDLLGLIVENQGTAVVESDENGVADPELQILDGDDPEFVVGPAEKLQGQVLGDRIVFAVAGRAAEKFRWGRPVIVDAPEAVVGDVPLRVHEGVHRFQLMPLVGSADGFEEGVPAVEAAGVALLIGGGIAGQSLIPFLEPRDVGGADFAAVEKLGRAMSAALVFDQVRDMTIVTTATTTEVARRRVSEIL